MAGRASAFAALGLPPGADAAAIEQAYKRLIKQHHPDREGGDSTRAAEINRAYRELRAAQGAERPAGVQQPFAAPPPPALAARRASRGCCHWRASLGMGPSVPRAVSSADEAQSPFRHERAQPAPDPIARRLHGRAIDDAVARSHALYRSGTKRRSPRQAAIASATSATIPARACSIAAPPSTMPSWAAGPRSAAGCGAFRSACGDRPAMERGFAAVGRQSRHRRAARSDQAEGRPRARAACPADRAAGEGPRPRLMFGRGSLPPPFAGAATLSERLLVLRYGVRRQRIFEIVGALELLRVVDWRDVLRRLASDEVEANRHALVATQ